MDDILLRIALLGVISSLITVFALHRYQQTAWLVLAGSSVLAFAVSDAHIAFRLFHLATVVVATTRFVNGRRLGGETS
ncbi:hypothetical protein AB0J13_11070 [Streptomyces anulatus]|uniref:hypothetical protein n=1 Tax=Streptomyces anulatus TaxID=1892 RepID=UPI0033CBA916